MISKLPWANTPSHLTSHLELTVRFCETDLMGIVHHANYLLYFEAGRVDWLKKRRVRYEDWMHKGIHLPVVETRVRHRKTARFDDRLCIASTCFEVTRITVRFGYLITRGDELVCEGETMLACVGADLFPRRFPAEAADVLRSGEVTDETHA